MSQQRIHHDNVTSMTPYRVRDFCLFAFAFITFVFSQDDRGSKLRGCGDSAVSKGTTDSGVVMEKEIPMLPGAVPRKLPPLSSEWVRESEADNITQQESTAQERQKSSEILEELLNQGIIPVGQTKEKSSGAGEAYSIMLNDTEVVRRRPPARLESLKAKKEQMLTSREDIEEKIRLAEERRKVQFVCRCVCVQHFCSSSLSPSYSLSFLSPTHFSAPFTFSQLREDELKMRESQNNPFAQRKSQLKLILKK
uniref:Stathmin domain containing 1 n=1 Tax=Anabas testudineus TaxID=64144 RepID=A0A7N6AU73_ANATE